MRIVLRQEFPLGRFHATPWRVNPYDDPYGEWPPSPWRLVRAVTARWYQWARETEPEPGRPNLEQLLAALCTSSYSFHLPPDARKGTPLRQYHPTEFGMDPPNRRHVARYQRATGGAPEHKPASAPTQASGKSKGRAARKEQKTPEEKANKEVRERVKALKGVKLSESMLAGTQFLEWEVTVKEKGAEDAKREVEAILGGPSTPWQRVADAGGRGYGKSLVQDNYWCVPPESPVWWFIEGDDWTAELRARLARCLERMTYLGRAETFTRVDIADPGDGVPEPNCRLSEGRISGAVPVLVPLASATRVDVERTTDAPEALNRSVPLGARVLYAVRPARAAVREHRKATMHRTDCHLIQFALGWNVAPEGRAVVRLTSRFRGAVIRELLRLRTGDAEATWTRVGKDVRASISDMAGKDAEDEPLKGHRHTEFFAWCEGEQPTRLVVWRGARAFDADEVDAIVLAASRDLSWAAAGPGADEWRVRVVPLDRDVPAPPGFDGRAAQRWESVTPYVAPRHHLRNGKQRENETLEAQIRKEIERRGVPGAAHVAVEVVDAPRWVAVHVPRRDAGKRAFIGDRLGHLVRLAFPSPVEGPIRLGHSSTFGLGLFRPASL